MIGNLARNALARDAVAHLRGRFTSEQASGLGMVVVEAARSQMLLGCESRISRFGSNDGLLIRSADRFCDELFLFARERKMRRLNAKFLTRKAVPISVNILSMGSAGASGVRPAQPQWYHKNHFTDELAIHYLVNLSPDSTQLELTISNLGLGTLKRHRLTGETPWKWEAARRRKNTGQRVVTVAPGDGVVFHGYSLVSDASISGGPTCYLLWLAYRTSEILGGAAKG